MNKNSEILYVNQLYENLIPSKEEGMVLYILYTKIKNNELPKYFTYRDIERCITESSKIETGATPQTEKIVKNLLHFYIERPPNEKLRFALSNHAIKFLELIYNKLYSPLKQFPLKKTFQKYAEFDASKFKNIEDFELWYKLQFHNNSKQTIIDHLEALKDVVNTSIKQLNDLLKDDKKSIVNITNEFVVVFDEIGKKSEEIKYTLRLGNILSQELEKVVSFFYQNVADYKHPNNKTEKEQLDLLNTNYEKSLYIQTEVNDFFTEVDYRLNQLKDRSLYASGQLTNLQNNFRNQSKIRINLKRLLKFALEQATYSKDHIVNLPIKFPIKAVPQESFKFTEIVYYRSFGLEKNFIIPAHYDEEYAKIQNKKVEKQLMRQEQIAQLFREYKGILENEKELNFTEHFYKILGEKDSEIAINLGFELFQYANKNPRFIIDIKRQLSTYTNNKNILVWNMKINQNQ